MCACVPASVRVCDTPNISRPGLMHTYESLCGLLNVFEKLRYMCAYNSITLMKKLLHAIGVLLSLLCGREINTRVRVSNRVKLKI